MKLDEFITTGPKITVMKPRIGSTFLSPRQTCAQAMLLHKPNFVKKRLLKTSVQDYRRKLKTNRKLWTRMKKELMASKYKEENEDESASDAELPPDLSTLTRSSEEEHEEEEEEGMKQVLRPEVFAAEGTQAVQESVLEHQTKLSTLEASSSTLRAPDHVISTEESQSDSGEEDVKEVRNFWLFESDQCEVAVLVMRHPCQVALSGCIRVQALSGSAEVHGWNLSADFPDSLNSAGLFSSTHYGRYVLATVKPEHLPKGVKLFKHLSTRLASANAGLYTASVRSVATADCVVLTISRLETSWSVQYAVSLLTPSVFSLQHGPFLSRRLGFSICQNLSGALIVTPEHRKVARQIIDSIPYARSVGAPAPRIVVCGNRDSGKSTFLKFLINSVLSVGACPSVYYLDGDPGQAEFTPSCCLSLVSVDSPLLGPPFTHHKTPMRQCFVGGPSVEDNPDVYTASFESLIGYYNEHCSTEPLFINTMGWLRGVGLSLLVDVLRLSHPTVVIQMDSASIKVPVLSSSFMAEECGWTTTRSLVPLDQVDTQFKRVVAVKETTSAQLGLAAPLQRQLSTLTYLGRVLANSPQHQLTKAQPKCVPFSEVSVLLTGKSPVRREDLLQVINGSWVALCSVPPAQVEEKRPSTLPKMAKLVPNQCLGFGLVRGIDLQLGAVLVLTPEPLFRLQMVNALAVMGDLLPAQVYTNQKSKGAVPYISQKSTSSKEGLGVKVKQTRKSLP